MLIRISTNSSKSSSNGHFFFVTSERQIRNSSPKIWIDHWLLSDRTRTRRSSWTYSFSFLYRRSIPVKNKNTKDDKHIYLFIQKEKRKDKRVNERERLKDEDKDWNGSVGNDHLFFIVIAWDHCYSFSSLLLVFFWPLLIWLLELNIRVNH